MRIIGGKDYYDSARAFGEDRENVFVRGKYDTAEWSKHPLGNDRYIGDYWSNGIPTVRVLFCGTIYTGARFQFPLSPVEYVWHKAIFEKYAEKINFNLVRRHRTIDLDYEFTPKELTGEKLSYVIDNKLVIGIQNMTDRTYERDKDDHWKMNTDGLKKLNFASAVDPYTAFQELSMFNGGVLPRSPNPMVELSGEKIMTQKHGFDKWSFRRHKDDVK